jgi:hypothetical protein
LTTLLIKISCTEPKIAVILLKSGNDFVVIYLDFFLETPRSN